MIQELRLKFNNSFTNQKYNDLLKYIEKDSGIQTSFRIAESPIFIDDLLKEKLLNATYEIISFAKNSEFIKLTDETVPKEFFVPNEDPHPTAFSIDFAICEINGEYFPKLIEAQGFPSLFFYQLMLAKAYRKFYLIPEEFTILFNDLSENEYLNILKNFILNNYKSDEVAIVEIEPEEQNTYIDLFYTSKYLGIPILKIQDIYSRGKKIYYKKGQEEKRIRRIYNRVIFDELKVKKDIELKFNFSASYNVEWVCHPNWFFRFSKYISILMDSRYVPKTTRLDKLNYIPKDLENYILKPLFSFSSTGVCFNVKESDILNIKNPKDYILQEKVKYAPIIQTPNGLSKGEIRIMAIWNHKDKEPKILTNLVRLSKGDIIGVKYNKNNDWVGGSIAFFKGK